jgi:hypothetical protein
VIVEPSPGNDDPGLDTAAPAPVVGAVDATGMELLPPHAVTKAAPIARTAEAENAFIGLPPR